jgi:membrane-associated phospholipid phosphatase
MARHSAAAIARWISIVAHPLVLALLLVGVSAAKVQGGRAAVQWLGVTAAVVVIPLWVFMWRKWRSGNWDTVDASAPKNRPLLYLRALLLMAAFTVCIGVLSEWDYAWLRGSVAVVGVITVAAILNRWIKLSNHMAFALFAAVVLLRVDWRVGAPLVAIVPLLAWSRIKLGRHSWPEVFGGACLGGAVGLLLIFV